MEDAFFIKTNAAVEVENMVKSNNLVMVTGNSGSGKSTIIQNIALQYRKLGWLVKPVCSFKEIYDVYGSEDFQKYKYVFVFNDPIGKEFYDEIQHNEWRRYSDILNLLIKKAKLLLTCRKSVFSDPKAAGFLQRTNEQNLVQADINKKHCELSRKEKEMMLKSHLPNVQPTREDIDRICSVDMYFPLLCSLCRAKSENTKEILKVFEEPVGFLKEEIESYKYKEKETYCALVCLILSKNHLCAHDLEENTKLYLKSLELCELPPYTLPSTILKRLEILCGFFVKKIGENYAFYHDFVMEVTSYVLGSENPKAIIQYANLSFLRKRVIVDEMKSSSPFTIPLKHTHIKILVDRLFEEFITDRFIEVILNPCLRNEDVIFGFKDKLKDLADKGNLHLISKKINKETTLQVLQNLVNERRCTRFYFVCCENECSPIFALIAFCHDELSFYCLKLLKECQIPLKKKCLFLALSCNGDANFLENFNETEIEKFKTYMRNTMYPIHIVSAFHNCNLLDKVISERLSIDVFTSHGNSSMTSLMFAVANDSLESDEINRTHKTVEVLIQRGANVNLCDTKRQSPLWMTCQLGNESMAQLLINKGADVNLCDEKGYSPLFIACLNGHESTAMVLLNNNANVNICVQNGVSPLLAACDYGYKGIAECLLNKGAMVNLSSEKGLSPLLVACKNGHENIVQLLLSHGAALSNFENNGRSPLFEACLSSHYNIVKLLLRHGADVNSGNKEKVLGITPLWISCKTRDESITELLLEHGANPNFCSKQRLVFKNLLSPLKIATNNGDQRIVQLLLKYGVNPN